MKHNPQGKGALGDLFVKLHTRERKEKVEYVRLLAYIDNKSNKCYHNKHKVNVLECYRNT